MAELDNVLAGGLFSCSLIGSVFISSSDVIASPNIKGSKHAPPFFVLSENARFVKFLHKHQFANQESTSTLLLFIMVYFLSYVLIIAGKCEAVLASNINQELATSQPHAFLTLDLRPTLGRILSTD